MSTPILNEKELKEAFDNNCIKFAESLESLIDPDSVVVITSKVFENGTIKSNMFSVGNDLLILHGLSAAFREALQKHTKEVIEWTQQKVTEEGA